MQNEAMLQNFVDLQLHQDKAKVMVTHLRQDEEFVGLAQTQDFRILGYNPSYKHTSKDGERDGEKVVSKLYIVQ
jgi:hypothetical protein